MEKVKKVWKQMKIEESLIADFPFLIVARGKYFSLKMETIPKFSLKLQIFPMKIRIEESWIADLPLLNFTRAIFNQILMMLVFSCCKYIYLIPLKSYEWMVNWNIQIFVLNLLALNSWTLLGGKMADCM